MTAIEAFQLTLPSVQAKIAEAEQLKLLVSGYQSALKDIEEYGKLVQALIERVKVHEPNFTPNDLKQASVVPANPGPGSNTAIPFPEK